jgi:hypothetical protein
VRVAGKALLSILREQAEKRASTTTQDRVLHIADRSDPALAMLLRKVHDSQRLLDAYVMAKTDVGGERSK